MRVFGLAGVAWQDVRKGCDNPGTLDAFYCGWLYGVDLVVAVVREMWRIRWPRSLGIW